VAAPQRSGQGRGGPELIAAARSIVECASAWRATMPRWRGCGRAAAAAWRDRRLCDGPRSPHLEAAIETCGGVGASVDESEAGTSRIKRPAPATQ